MGIFKKRDNKSKQGDKKSDLGFIVVFFLVVVVLAYVIFALVKNRITTYVQPEGGADVAITIADGNPSPSSYISVTEDVEKDDSAISEASLAGGNTEDYTAFDAEKEAEGIDYDSLDFYKAAKEYQEATSGAEEIDPSTLSSVWNDYTADMRYASYTANGNEEELISDPTDTYPAAAYTVLYKILDNYGWTHYQLLETGYENGDYYLMYVFAVGYSNGMKAEYSVYYAPSDNVAWAVRVQQGYYSSFPDPSDSEWVSIK